MPITLSGSTGVAGVDGSPGTPAIQGVDPNTGLTFPAADTVALVTGGSERLRAGPSGQLGIAGANYGTSGQVLTSGGAAAAPSWATPATSAINTQTFNSSGTWTKPAGYSASSRVMIQVWGAGGSGSRNTSTGNCYGGGGGGYNERWLNLSDMGATETITIGAGGTARTGSNQDGAAGGNSSVGSLITAYGGSAGFTTSAGAGGGQLSAPLTGQSQRATVVGIAPEIIMLGANWPGRPRILTTYYTGNIVLAYQGHGMALSVEVDPSALAAFWHGGGGGIPSATASFRDGTPSVWGGGGGGSHSTGAGGVSSFGGNGGAAGATGTAGSQPGGGGGAGTSTSGAGGAGRVIITVFPA